MTAKELLQERVAALSEEEAVAYLQAFDKVRAADSVSDKPLRGRYADGPDMLRQHEDEHAREVAADRR